MNDINIQDCRSDTVGELLKENKRRLKLVLRRALDVVETKVNVILSPNVSCLSDYGVEFSIVALVNGGNHNNHGLQNGDRVDSVIFLLAAFTRFSPYPVYSCKFLVV